MFLKQPFIHLRSLGFSGGSTAPCGKYMGTFLVVPMMAVIERTGASLDHLQCSDGPAQTILSPNMSSTYPLDVYIGYTYLFIMCYTHLFIKLIVFLQCFNIHWNFPQMQSLSKMWENHTLFCWEFYQDPFTISGMPYSIWAASTAYLYLSSFVAVACKYVTGDLRFIVTDLELNVF